MKQDRLISTLLTLAETLAALGVAVFLTLLLIPAAAALYFLGEDGHGTLSERLLATSYHIEFPLLEADTGRVTSHDDLVHRLQALQVAEKVQVIGEDEPPLLVLSGTSSVGRVVSAASQVLQENGFERSEFSSRRTLDFLEYLQEPRNLRKLIPASLTLQALIFIGVGVLLVRLRLPRPVPIGVRGHAVGGLWGIAAGLLAFGCSMLIALFLHLIGMPPQEQAWLTNLLEDRAAILALAPWILVAVPLSEEVFFRAYVFRFVASRVSVPAGLLFSSLMFAAIHLNPSGILIYFAVGLILALVYVRTRSFLAPFVAHATYNGLVLIAAVLTRPG